MRKKGKGQAAFHPVPIPLKKPNFILDFLESCEFFIRCLLGLTGISVIKE